MYKDISEKMVGSELSYRACVIRALDDTGHLTTVARAGDGITWDGYRDGPISPAQGLAGKVLASGDKEIVEVINGKKSAFENVAWVEANGLKSCVILPLKTKKQVFGTISLFTGHIHRFSIDDIHLLESLAFLIASFVESMRLGGELHKTQHELRMERDRILGSARAVGFNLSDQSLLHDYKHELQRIQSELKVALETSPNHRLRLIKRLVRELDTKEQQIKGEMERVSTERLRKPVHINQAIQGVVRIFELELMGTDECVDIALDLSDRIPLLVVHEAEIREIVFNLVSNAIKSIKRAGRRQGKVKISTKIVNPDIPYVRISVEDNGEGIANEESERIFDRGYSTDTHSCGMGLFVSRIITENIYGGRLEFDSVVGKGTSFCVLLPLRRLQA
jgi:signal transduction histidine kinase